MTKSYFLYNVENRCMFEDGLSDFVNLFVYAEDEWKARKYAEEFLLSENSHWKVSYVIHQSIGISKSFVATEGTILN